MWLRLKTDDDLRSDGSISTDHANAHRSKYVKYGRRHYLVRVSGEFEFSEFELSRFYCISICMGKNYCFCNQRMLRDLNKNGLESIKLCHGFFFSSVLSTSRFMAILWGFLNRLALSITLSTHKTGINRLGNHTGRRNTHL